MLTRNIVVLYRTTEVIYKNKNVVFVVHVAEAKVTKYIIHNIIEHSSLLYNMY